MPLTQQSTEPGSPTSVADLDPFERAAFEQSLFEQKLSRLAESSVATELALQVLTSGVLLNQPIELFAASAFVQVELMLSLKRHLASLPAPRLRLPALRQPAGRRRRRARTAPIAPELQQPGVELASPPELPA